MRCRRIRFAWVRAMTASNELVASFVDLFGGRRDAVGGEDGVCIRTNQTKPWTSFIDGHLHRGGKEAIGVYPMVCMDASEPVAGNWEVKWGCVDWDDGEEESWAHARRVQTLLAKCGVTSWIERSRSKGYHLWVFGDWTPAHIVRRGLLKACQAVGAPTREINPKSESFDNPDTLGNYVRLPYPGHLHALPHEGTRRVVVDGDGYPYSLGDFLRVATELRGMEGLEKLAALWQPPKPIVQRTVVDITDEDLEEALGRVSKRTIDILMDGPTRGQGRSETLFWLAQLLHRDGLHTYDECLALVKHADKLWGGKFVDRPDADRRYSEMIDKSWSE